MTEPQAFVIDWGIAELEAGGWIVAAHTSRGEFQFPTLYATATEAQQAMVTTAIVFSHLMEMGGGWSAVDVSDLGASAN